MSRNTGHEEIQDILASGNADAVSGAEWERLRAHLAECEACSRDLEELHPSLVVLLASGSGKTIDPARSARVRTRLLARASAEHRISGPDPARARGDAARLRGWAGWAVAAGMASLLLTHHAFHQPLAFGWAVAAALGVLLVGVGIYAAMQRKRAAALRGQLAAMEQERQFGAAFQRHGPPTRE